MHNNTSLYRELANTLAGIEAQLTNLRESHTYTAEQLGRPLETPDAYFWLKAQDRHGNYLATPLLLAKAQCLSAMVAIKAMK